MKLLVTGREGQVARGLAEAALRCGIETVFIARPIYDLRNAAGIVAAVARHRPRAVINAAAYTQVDQAENYHAMAFAVNTDGAAHVAQACAAYDLPLIHLSTDYVFDGEKSSPYVESDATKPVSVYGHTKLAGECAVSKLCARHLIVRNSWVHSQFGRNFVRTMLDLAATESVVNVVSDQHGSPTFAPHLADALLAMARAAVSEPDGIAWGVYQAAGRGKTNWSDFAQEIFTQAKVCGLPFANVMPIASCDYQTLARRPANSRLDGKKLRDAFGIVLPDWQNGVRECVARIAAEHVIGE